jgi:membrane associated rhomboid family serine protease
MIPLRDENPAQSTPIVTRLLIAANVAMFVFQMTLGESMMRFAFDWGMVPLRLTRALEGGGETVLAAGIPLLTSMFLHGGLLHVLGNVWYLAIFGDNVEDRLGHVTFLVFYLVAGIAAGLIHFTANSTSPVPAVGASGAIAGVLGAYLVAYPHARVITLVPLFPFFQLMALPAVIVLGLWFVYQFLSGALTLGLVQRPGGGIAWWAHIGGFAFGVVAMIVLGSRRPRGSWARVE